MCAFVRVCAHVLIYIDLGNVKGKNYVKKEIILKSHFSIKLQKVSFLVSQFYSQLLLVNQITVQLPGLSQSMFYCNSVYKYSISVYNLKYIVHHGC